MSKNTIEKLIEKVIAEDSNSQDDIIREVKKYLDKGRLTYRTKIDKPTDKKYSAIKQEFEFLNGSDEVASLTVSIYEFDTAHFDGTIQFSGKYVSRSLYKTFKSEKDMRAFISSHMSEIANTIDLSIKMHKQVKYLEKYF